MNDIFRQWLVNFGCFIFGLVARATAMIYVYEQPTTKPVVTVEQTKADETRQLQRVKELRFSLEKLERAKAVQDAFLKQAVVNQDDIRTRVAKLGEGKR